MFFWCNEFKRLIIPKHSEDNVADFVHNGSDSNDLFLAGTFADIIIINDRIYGDCGERNYLCIRPKRQGEISAAFS